MVEDMFPVQFVEGINEGEEADNSKLMEIGPYSHIAIEYQAQSAYKICQLEILTATKAIGGAKECDVMILPNYIDKPNRDDLILAQGTMELQPSKELMISIKWSEVMLEPNIIIRPNLTYWIVMTSKGKSLKLIKGKEGKKIRILDRNPYNMEWTELELIDGGWEVMLRFYGKILPTQT